MGDISYSTEKLASAAQQISQYVQDGQGYQHHLQQLLAEIDRLPSDLRSKILPNITDWHTQVQTLYTQYDTIATHLSQGSTNIQVFETSQGESFQSQ